MTQEVYFFSPVTSQPRKSFVMTIVSDTGGDDDDDDDGVGGGCGADVSECFPIRSGCYKS